MARPMIDVYTNMLKPLLESKDISSLVLAYFLLSNKEDFTTWVNANISRLNKTNGCSKFPRKIHPSVMASFRKIGIVIKLSYEISDDCYLQLINYYEKNIKE